MIAGDAVPRDDAELDSWLQEQLRPVRRTEQDEHDAEDCRRELEKLVQDTLQEGERWHLVLFGSSVNGFGMRSSDLDITALPDGPAEQGPDHGGDLAGGVLGRLASSLGRRAGRGGERGESFKVKESILTAKLPILKLLRGSVEVDLSVDNRMPLWNTRLLRAYASIDQRVVSLVLGVKLWAQKHDLVGASKGHLSSYALAQLAIHFLQRGVHPPLPNLHVAFGKDPAAFENDETALEVVKSWGAWPARATLAALYRGFFRFYAEEFEFGTEVVSVRLGRRALLRDVPVIDSASTKPRPRLHVEDPFELSRDLGHVLRDGGVQLMGEIRKEHRQLAVPWPAARHPCSVSAAEGRVAGVPLELGLVGPDPASVPKTPLRAPPRMEQEQVGRAMGPWSASLSGGSAVKAQPPWSSAAGPAHRDAHVSSSRMMPREHVWELPSPAHAPAASTSAALLQQWPLGAPAAGTSRAHQQTQSSADPGLATRTPPAQWLRSAPAGLASPEATLASRTGRNTEPPGRRARGDLHAACQKIIGGNRQENGAQYSEPRWVGDGYRCTVRVPKLPDSWGRKIWIGHACETEQDSKHSAAQVALDDILSCDVFLAKYRAPPKRFAPLDPSVSVKDHLHSTCLRIHRLTPEKDGEVKYESHQVGGLYRCTVRMPRLPDGFGQKVWVGDECETENDARKSVAWVALKAIFDDEGLMARHNAPPARVTKLQQARKRKQ